MKDKLRFIFLPFVLALFGLVIVYTFLHWIFFIVLDVFPLKEIVGNFGIPLFLSALMAWIIIRPRLKALKLESNGGRLRDFYSFMMWVMLSIPLIIAQEYIVTATGKITKLNSINEINAVASTKYYQINKYYADKSFTGRYSAFDVSGKYNQSFNMHFYIVLPLFEKAEDTLANNVLAWLGVKYSKTISNRLSQFEKERQYGAFIAETQKRFAEEELSGFAYFERVAYSDNRDGYLSAIANNGVYKPSENILTGVKEPYEKRNGKKLAWLLGTAFAGIMIWLIMVMIPGVDKKQMDRIRTGKPDKKALKERREFLALLKPQDGYFITLILVYINIGIFVLMMICGYGFIQFNGQDLMRWGANFGPVTKNGEWWRLFTSVFLHGGLMHLLLNMYGLLFVGIFLEPLLGRVKYLCIYLLTGIMASASSVWWYTAIISVGASGAIFGLYGVFLALMLRKIFPRDFARSFLVSTVVFIGFNLLIGLTGGIDNAAHIGGLLSGFVIGIILSYGFERKIKKEQR